MPDLLPVDYDDCTTAQRGIVQVIVTADGEADSCQPPLLASNSVACAIGRCRKFDPFWNRSVSYSATIIIESTFFGGAPWSVGTPSVGAADLVSTLTHELGHVANLTHPATAAAVMAPGLTNSSKRRELFQWDLECASECAKSRTSPSTDRRYGTIRTRQVSLAGSPVFSTEGSVPISVADVSTAFRKNGSSWLVTRSETSPTCSSGHAWSSSMTGSGVCLSTFAFAPTDGVSPISAVFREDETRQYVMSVATSDSLASSGQMSHRVRFASSTDQFWSSTNSALQHCTSTTAFMNCVSSTHILTAEAPAFTWLPGPLTTPFVAGASVSVWVNSLRDESSNDRKVFISVGNHATGLVGQPDLLSIKTSTPPVVACNQNFSSTYDCIVVFSPLSDTSNRLFALRLSIQDSATRFNSSEEVSGPRSISAGSLVVRSANRPALAVVNNEFLLVVRSASSNQPLLAFRSSDAVTWVQVNETIGYSVTSPQIQTSWPDAAITKQIIYTRP